MRVFVPYAADSPKTRLAPVMDDAERRAFARAMLDDVLTVVRATGREPTVLATAPTDVDGPVVVDDRPLTDAVNAVLAEGVATAVVMADLALATPDAISRLFSTDGEVVLAPGRGGGTNALVSRHPEFRVDYHGASILDHRRAARDVGVDVATVDSFRLSTDVDEPGDLTEVLLHGTGQSRRWLDAQGFTLDVGEGRVDVTRETSPPGGDRGEPRPE